MTPRPGTVRDSWTSDVGGRSRLTRWRRRHLSLRKVVALAVLASFLAPGFVALIAAVL
jgi:hypothetical protein